MAVTGTISLDGTVGAIGGLRQKASAVAQAGVDVFIVPAAQGEDDIAAAREAAGGDLEIVPVETLERGARGARRARRRPDPAAARRRG